MECQNSTWAPLLRQPQGSVRVKLEVTSRGVSSTTYVCQIRLSFTPSRLQWYVDFWILDFQLCLTLSAELLSGAGVRRLSVRKLRFLGNCCLDPDEFLWAARRIHRISTHFFFFFNFQFSNFFSFSLTWDPIWDQKFQNATPPPIFIQPEPNITINKVVMRELKV